MDELELSSLLGWLLQLVQFGNCFNVQLCTNITDPDVCVDSEILQSGACATPFCCDTSSSCNESDASALRTSLAATNFDNKSCLYQTDVAICQLYNLHINENDNIAGWSYHYESSNDQASSFYKTNVSLWFNMCDAPYLSLTGFNSISGYVGYNSIVACTNSSSSSSDPICSAFGDTNPSGWRSVSYLNDSDPESGLNIALDSVQCAYIGFIETLHTTPKCANIELVCETSASSVDPSNYAISRIDGPFLAFHNGTDGSCGHNATLTITSTHACPHWKISSGESFLVCPHSFNGSNLLINCTLLGFSIYQQGKYPAGDLSDVTHSYLNISAIMNLTNSSSLGWTHLSFDLNFEQTGVFIISIDLTSNFNISSSNKKSIMQRWDGITIWANVSYNNTASSVALIGNTKYFINFTGTFSHGSHSGKTTVQKVIDHTWSYALIGISLFVSIHFVFRLINDSQARLFSMLCVKCQCCRYGRRFCWFGCYVCCCGCQVNQHSKAWDLHVMVAGHASLRALEIKGFDRNKSDPAAVQVAPQQGRLSQVIFGFGSGETDQPQREETKDVQDKQSVLKSFWTFGNDGKNKRMRPKGKNRQTDGLIQSGHETQMWARTGADDGVGALRKGERKLQVPEHAGGNALNDSLSSMMLGSSLSGSNVGRRVPKSVYADYVVQKASSCKTDVTDEYLG